MKTLTVIPIMLASICGCAPALAQTVADDAAVIAAVRHIATKLHNQKDVRISEIGVDVELAPSERQPDAAVRFASMLGATPVATGSILACTDSPTAQVCTDTPQVVIKIFRSVKRSAETAEVGINLIENLGGTRRPSEQVMIFSMELGTTGWKVVKVDGEFIT